MGRHEGISQKEGVSRDCPNFDSEGSSARKEWLTPPGRAHPERTRTIEEFMPMLRRVTAQPRHSIYLKKEQAP
jgi:hypothetical protein